MGLEDTRFAYLLDTVEAICRSPKVVEYIIGITAEPNNRRRSYRDAVALQYPHFVILATGLTSERALQLEADLQTAVRGVPICYRKYHPDRRDASHRRGLGGTDRYEGQAVYSAYMTWRSEQRVAEPRRAVG